MSSGEKKEFYRLQHLVTFQENLPKFLKQELSTSSWSSESP